VEGIAICMYNPVWAFKWPATVHRLAI
jgi:hypothetical protein